MKPLTTCRWLENKGFVVGHAEGSDDPDDYATPCWCLKTHDAIGPDGDGADLGECVRGRECFEPELDI